MTADRYPSIYKAALLIALDNGGIYRGRSVEQQSREFEKWIVTQPQELLPAIDEWLSGLSDEDMYMFCCGGADEPESKAIGALAPPFADQLLNDYFDEVC